MSNAQSQYGKQKKQVDKKISEEEQRVNKKVNEVVFPLLQEISSTVDEAALLPAVLKTALQQAVLNEMMKMKLGDLHLEDQLKGGKEEDWIKFAKLIKVLEDEPISIVYNILEGLGDEIALKQRLYWKNVELSKLYEQN